MGDLRIDVNSLSPVHRSTLLFKRLISLLLFIAEEFGDVHPGFTVILELVLSIPLSVSLAVPPTQLFMIILARNIDTDLICFLNEA